MNEQQKKEMSQIKPASSSNLERLKQKTSEDFMKYFETTYQPPNMRDAQRRKRKDTDVLYDFHIPEGMMEAGKGKKYLIRTYGCQMNEHDTEVMAGILEAMGYESTDTAKEADIILLNTCAIRENAENKVFGEIGHLKPLKTENPNLILGVCGCMSQEESVVNRILKKHPFIDLIFGTHNIHKLPELVQEAVFGKEMVIDVWSKEGDIIENLPRSRKGRIKAWVNIMYGCDKFCTYCIVPYTRGKERSRLPEDIIQEVRHLAAQGIRKSLSLVRT
ncbi:(dimethylallyl)adenosine tRNA methylthiotransferase [Halobacillus sp. BAB-2008]|nr:(dimethylallyl)adenosine tRNA methylthiotransferase [Halobacillus sp. BAB-2008]